MFRRLMSSLSMLAISGALSAPYGAHTGGAGRSARVTRRYGPITPAYLEWRREKPEGRAATRRRRQMARLEAKRAGVSS